MMFPDPRPLRDELIRLLELQLSALEKEDFGIITAPEILRYQRRQERIDELYDQLLAKSTVLHHPPPVGPQNRDSEVRDAH